MKRRLWIALLAIAVLVAAAAVFLQFFLGSAVRKAFLARAPALLQTTVALSDVDVSLWTGRVVVEGLVIGNPEGFTAPEAIRLERFNLELKPASLFRDTLVIERVRIDAPQITYELGLGENNLSRLQKNLKKKSGPPQGGPPPPPAPGGRRAPRRERKIVIEDLLLQEGQVRVCTSVLPGARATVALPAIHLTGIGKARGGVTYEEAVAEILAQLVDAAKGTAREGIKGSVDLPWLPRRAKK